MGNVKIIKSDNSYADPCTDIIKFVNGDGSLSRELRHNDNIVQNDGSFLNINCGFVSIFWDHLNSVNPYVQSALVCLRNGVEFFRKYGNEQGSFSAPVGMFLQFRQISFKNATPWPDNGTGQNFATLLVQRGSNPIYDNVVSTQETELHGDNFNFRVLEGQNYIITNRTSSTMTGYTGRVLGVNNSRQAGIVSIKLQDSLTQIDGTGNEINELYLNIEGPGLVENGQSYRNFNTKSGGSFLTAIFKLNTEGDTINYTITGINSYFASGSLSGFQDMEYVVNIPKGDINITIF